jgi:hypothetical protein
MESYKSERPGVGELDALLLPPLEGNEIPHLPISAGLYTCQYATHTVTHIHMGDGGGHTNTHHLISLLVFLLGNH